MKVKKVFSVVVAKECPSTNKVETECGRFCHVCGGKGFVLTTAGKRLIQFLKEFGEFADKDHGHSIT